MVAASGKLDTGETMLLTDAYDIARSDALVLRHSQPDILQISGNDRLDFLNRICTNKLSSMLPGGFKSTVLTNANARIVDVLQILQREDDALLLTSPNRGKLVEERLKGYIFFQDDVQIHPWKEIEVRFWGIYGPNSLKVLNNTAPSLAELKNGKYHSLKEGFIIPSENDRLNGFHVLMNSNIHLDPSWDEGTQPTRMAAYQALRIEAGIPEVGHEITDERIPLEVGLDDLISFTKGCYIGQEIIARLDSRDQLARRMIGISLARPAQEGSMIFQNGAAIGTLTSVAQSPRYGNIGLCVVRTKGVNIAASVIVNDNIADFTSLPFE